MTNLRYDAGEVITAMVTPFNAKKEVDYASLESVSRHLIEQKSDAVVVAGTTGECPTLTHEEEHEILYCVKSTVSGQCKVIMGAGSNSTDTAVMSSKKAQELGADAILSVVPYYNKPSQQGLIEHFGAIAKSVDLPIILYNIQGRTGIDMAPSTIAFLAKEYSNIVGVKQSNSNLDLISEIKMLCPDDFVIYSGDDSLTLPMMSIGAHGVVSVASHVIGSQIKSMIRNYKTGSVVAACNMHKILYPLFKKIFMAPNPTPIKALLSKLGIIENQVRRPLVELDEQARLELLETLQKVLRKTSNI
ncbi:MAG: 4-hydroxy-tetrahydrodipicolinate synthase [Candidatus Gastranaerophilales bacterium]|nr:4-hydroxy-tetrahydrodipicolinate synthase [Candidatus Gastranaerophilales bacterium]